VLSYRKEHRDTRTCRDLLGGGAVILAAFAAEGPAHCSGLPVARYDSAGLAAELTGAYDDAVTITNCCDEQHRTGVLQPFTWITARLSRQPRHASQRPRITVIRSSPYIGLIKSLAR
jgi:hypothetical protein